MRAVPVMRITIEYEWLDLPKQLRRESDSDIRTIIETALHESLAEWRGQNLISTDPADLPPEERAAVRAMLGAEVVLCQDGVGHTLSFETRRGLRS